MLKQIFRRTVRQPVFALAVALFAAVLAVILCHLHTVALEEQESYESAYASVPVTFRVTDLDGSKPSNLVGWSVDVFDADRVLSPSLASFVKELHVRTSTVAVLSYRLPDEDGGTLKDGTYWTVAGITSLYVAEELTEDWGGEVVWYEGYDESVLGTDQLVCLVPEAWKDIQQVSITKDNTYFSGQQSHIVSTTKELTVAGYYIDKGNTRVYLPFETVSRILAAVRESKEIVELCGLLNDNHALPELKEAAAKWFAEPNPAGEPTPWGRFDYDYYLYALDIDDTMLENLSIRMKTSIRVNALASAVVFILSAGAGFLTGFLVIRSRKRDIGLMRTLGASNVSIFAEFALEQILCIAAGIILGGSYSMWQPMNRLLLFGGIYTAGLAVALIIFLRKNLLTTMKEEE